MREFTIIYLFILTLRAQHNSVFTINVPVHVARSARWRKKFTKIHCVDKAHVNVN